MRTVLEERTVEMLKLAFENRQRKSVLDLRWSGRL